MMDSLEDINTLFDVLAKTNIENAEASMEEDKINILALVEKEIGFVEFNNLVNNLLRVWVVGLLMNLVHREEEEGEGKNERLRKPPFCQYFLASEKMK